jgi:hypothetical protein
MIFSIERARLFVPLCGDGHRCAIGPSARSLRSQAGANYGGLRRTPPRRWVHLPPGMRSPGVRRIRRWRWLTDSIGLVCWRFASAIVRYRLRDVGNHKRGMVYTAFLVQAAGCFSRCRRASGSCFTTIWIRILVSLPCSPPSSSCFSHSPCVRRCRTPSTGSFIAIDTTIAGRWSGSRAT